MSTKGNLDNIYRGDTVSLILESKDNQGKEIDITGRQYTLTLKNNEDDLDASAVLQKTFVASGALALKGKVEIRLESTETNLTVKEYWLGIQRVIPGSPPDVFTVHKQQIEILQDITTTV